MKAEWSIRAYTEGDDEKIFDLTRAVFSEREFDLKHWLKQRRWLYQENPAGAGKIWLAEHKSKIVGQYAITSVNMKIGNEIIAGSQSVDTMTHPDYRHQGIFETLANKTYKEAEEKGIDIIYGFPNQYSYPGFIKKLGWFDIATMRNMFKVLNWENALRAKTSRKFLLKLGAIGGSLGQGVFCRTEKAPMVSNLVIREISSFNEGINQFWNRVSNKYQIMVVRDRNYLNWRYVGVPETRYSTYVAEIGEEICGFIALRNILEREVKVSVICDLLAQSENIAQRLVSEVVEHCQQEKADIIFCSFLADRAYVTALRRNGFIFRPFLKNRYFCAYSGSSRISKKLLMDPQNWFIQMGDSDQI